MSEAGAAVNLAELPLPWQRHQWAQVIDQIANGKLAHAILLRGPAGLAKADFAQALAQALLCQAPREHCGPCGHCASCVQVQARHHPDIFPLAPDEDKTVIRVDQIRALAADLMLTSHDGGAKVAIINPADGMNVHAANSLLKTLEEPPAATFLLLISAHPTRLPATIRSRCQSLSFTAPPADAAKNWLKQHLDGRDWAPLLALAGNTPLAAAKLARVDADALRTEMVRAVLQIMAGHLDPVVVADRYAKHSGELISRVLNALAADMLRLKLIADVDTLVNADCRERLQKAAASLDLERLFAYTDRLKQVRAMLDTPANSQLLLESLLLPWAERLKIEASELQ